MKEFLIFRTDRVGDFLFSLLIIKLIKKNYPNSYITLVASEKNYEYAKTFNVIDKIIILKKNLFSKINLVFKLRKKKYDVIILHDGKNRSKFISFFLKTKKKVSCAADLKNTQIEIIKIVCKKININFEEDSLNFLDDRRHPVLNIPFSKYLLLHFDEKWIYNNYIKKYKNIEPTKNELIDFIRNLVKKNNLIITTGREISKLLNDIRFEIDYKEVKIFDKQNLLEIENIVFNSSLLISCHGWITHIAAAKNIKQIDIIDNSYPYDKWTSHLRNYNCLHRKSFKVLSKEIIDLI